MVAIKDIEMPKNCGECNCSGTDVCKKWVYLNGYDLGKKRADDCPLVEIEERNQKLEKIEQIVNEWYDLSFVKTAELIKEVLEQE